MQCYYEHINGKDVDITEEVPYELPMGWEWTRVSNIADVRDGTHNTPKYVSHGYPLVTSKNLINGKIDFLTAKLISKDDLIEINKRSNVDNGDILFAMIGSILVGLSSYFSLIKLQVSHYKILKYTYALTYF